MYTQDFWNEIYRMHFDDAPWMDDGWKGPLFQALTSDVQSLLHGGLEGASLLDYGCGNGHVGYHFAQMGMTVDLADISSVLVDKLQSAKPAEYQVNIYQASEPKQLPLGNTYDIILTLSLFHHITPSLWPDFISQFAARLNPGASMIISGWDESDPIIRSDMGLARYTQNPTWCINSLQDTIQKLNMTIYKSELIAIPVPGFGSDRCFRYIIASKPI